MKRLFVFISTIVLVANAVSAQNTFFPTKEGTVVSYKSFDKKGKETSGAKYSILNVKGTGDNIDITYQVESLDNKEVVVYKDEVTIQQRGDKMYFDMSNFINKGAFQQNGEIPASVEITGNSMEIPTNAQAGQALPDASVTMAMKLGIVNMKMSADITNRKVEGWEDITVKGGTFKCCKFSGDVTAKILGMTVTSKNTEWYAKGVGIVKSETYGKKGDIETTRELVEIKQ